MSIHHVTEQEQFNAIEEPMSKYAKKRAKKNASKAKQTLQSDQAMWIALNAHINNTTSLWSEEDYDVIAQSFIDSQGMRTSVQEFYNEVRFKKFKEQVTNVKFVIDAGIKLLVEKGTDQQWLELVAKAASNDVGFKVQIDELPHYYKKDSIEGVLQDIAHYKETLDKKFNEYFVEQVSMHMQKEMKELAMGEASEDPETLNQQQEKEMENYSTASIKDIQDAVAKSETNTVNNGVPEENVWTDETIGQTTMGITAESVAQEQYTGNADTDTSTSDTFARVKDAAAKAAAASNKTRCGDTFFDYSFKDQTKIVGSVALLGVVSGAASYAGIKLAEKASVKIASWMASRAMTA